MRTLLRPTQLPNHLLTEWAMRLLAAHRHAYGVSHEVKVKQIIPNSKIVIKWPASSGGTTIAEMSFSNLEDGQTMVKVSESGWPTSAEGFKASYKNCEGWQHMMSCMKT